MGGYELYSLSVSPEELAHALIGLAKSPQPLTINDIETVIDKGETYTRAVVRLGTQLSVIQNCEDGYITAPELREEARKMSPDQGPTVLSRFAQQYDPFMTYMTFIADGYESDRAAETVVTLFNIDVKPDIVERQFLKLGQYTNLLSDEGRPQPTIEVDALPTGHIDDLQEAAESEAGARLFVRKRLGRDITEFADSEPLEKLQKAMVKYQSEPDSAIVDAVVATESFTRKLADEYGSSDVDYSNAFGIGMLGKALRRDGLILKRHLHAANYLGGMRVPGAHGKEAETVESWQVDPEVSLEVILAAISYIRSLYWYVTHGHQIL